MRRACSLLANCNYFLFSISVERCKQLFSESVVGCLFVFSVTAEDNLLGWFCVEDDGNQIKKEKHPLLVRHMPVMMAKQQEFKVNRTDYTKLQFVFFCDVTSKENCIVNTSVSSHLLVLLSYF